MITFEAANGLSRCDRGAGCIICKFPTDLPGVNLDFHWSKVLFLTMVLNHEYLQIFVFLATICSTMDVIAETSRMLDVELARSRVSRFDQDRHRHFGLQTIRGGSQDYLRNPHSRKLGPLQMTWGIADPMEGEWRKELLSEIIGEDEIADTQNVDEEEVFHRFLKTGVLDAEKRSLPRIRSSPDEAARVAALGMARDFRRKDKQELHKKLIEQEEAKERRHVTAQIVPNEEHSTKAVRASSSNIEGRPTKKVVNNSSAYCACQPFSLYPD
jgi:hypothetical protein